MVVIACKLSFLVKAVRLVVHVHSCFRWHALLQITLTEKDSCPASSISCDPGSLQTQLSHTFILSRCMLKS